MKKHRIKGQFIPHTREMMESCAWRVLSLTARRVLDVIELEYMRHGGKDNGRLPVTRDNFHAYGIDRQQTNTALRELEALGFIEITQRGTVGKAGQRRPNLYRLTYLPSFGKEATNEWQEVLSMQAAEGIAREARLTPRKLKEAAEQGGKTTSFAPPAENTNGVEKSLSPGWKNHLVPEATGWKNHPKNADPHRVEKPPIFLETLSTSYSAETEDASETGETSAGRVAAEATELELKQQVSR